MKPEPKLKRYALVVLWKSNGSGCTLESYDSVDEAKRGAEKFVKECTEDAARVSHIVVIDRESLFVVKAAGKPVYPEVPPPPPVVSWNN